METRRIGRTDLRVSTLGIGGNALGNLYAAIDETGARDTVVAAHQAGATSSTRRPCTATACPSGAWAMRSEGYRAIRSCCPRRWGGCSSRTARCRPPRPTPKQGGIFTAELPFLPTFDFSYDATLRSFEDSLQRLGMNRVDILLIHDSDEWSQGSRYEEALRTVESGTLRALRKLKDEGTMAPVGAGVNQAEACERLMDIGDFDCFMLAGRYTLLEQGGLDSFLPRAEAAGVSVLLAAPFNSGILVTGAVEGTTYNYLPAPDDVLERVRGISRVCAAHNVPLAAAALQFVLGHPAVATVIPGSRSRAEAEQNAAWATVPIPPALWSDLRSEGLLRGDAPVPA